MRSQGMNFLAAFLLLWTPEEQAFWLLCFIVEDVLPDHFGRNMIGSLIDQKVLIHYMQVRIMHGGDCCSLTVLRHAEGPAASAWSPVGARLSFLGAHHPVALLPLRQLGAQIRTPRLTLPSHLPRTHFTHT